ncbi:hypothetical protein ABR737_00200 [Streptomyces sp. Edi2]|uniref:hypothetical protein n=1 Tax=Streptomyces sp. Edi2 TaxID=3162528 RepID=UPI00330571B0
MTNLTPASQKLLREIARHDMGAAVSIRYLSRGRYTVDRGTTAYNRNSFRPLFEQGLVTGWDEHDDAGPMRVTESGRKLAAALATQQCEKKPRPKPSADGRAALCLLRKIAKLDEPALIYSDSRGPRIWRLGSRDGYRAAVDTWTALQHAGLIHIEYGFAGGQRVSATAAGHKRLTT